MGSFTKINTTGTQSITGLSFQAKALIFWTSGSAAASGTWNPDIWQGIGFTSGPTESYAVAGGSIDSNATSAAEREIAAKAIVLAPVFGVASAMADLTSFDSDGFTLNWTSMHSTHDGVVINFLAIGGDDVSAKVVNWTSPTATGNKAVTGVGFQPEVVLHATAWQVTTIPASGPDHQVSIGAMDAAGGQWTNAVFAKNGQASSDTYRYQRTDKALSIIEQSAIRQEASFVSMDADGFTTNFTTTSTSAYRNVSLCLSGVDAKVGNFAKTSSAAPASQAVTGVGFEPGAVLLSNNSANADTVVNTHAIWSLGAGDGTNERMVLQSDQDNLSDTSAESLWKNDKVVATLSSFNVIGAEADLTSLDANGFTLNWTTNNSSATQMLYLALA